MIFNKNKSKCDIIAKSIKMIICDNDGTLTPGHTFYSKNGEELKQYHHHDGRGVFLMRLNSILFGIITGENSKIVNRRAEKLNADFVYTGVTNKLSILNKIVSDFKLEKNEIAYVGDDTNDLHIMKEVGLSFAVSNSHNEIIKYSDIICTKEGGNGALREVVDYIIQFKKNWVI